MTITIVFYDGNCGFCDQVVQLLLKLDRNKVFVFAPLQGQTASVIPQSLRKIDSVILIENYKEYNQAIYTEAMAIWRICWLLGGGWAFFGVLSYLPGWLFDWGYRIVARYRHLLVRTPACVIPSAKDSDRFLP